ncbi:MAG: phosphate ABC transporter permease PstA [Pseudomonadota bacterium]
MAGSRKLTAQGTESVQAYVRSGAPYVWTTAGAVAIAVLIVGALLLLIAARGLPHFWPADVVFAQYQPPGRDAEPVLAEVIEVNEVSTARLKSAGLPVDDQQPVYERALLKVGNRDLSGADFRFALSDWLIERRHPENIVVLERLEYGNFYGTLKAVRQSGQMLAEGEAAYEAWQPLQDRVSDLREKIEHLEKNVIGSINFKIEKLRLAKRRLELDGRSPRSHPQDYAVLDEQRTVFDAEYNKVIEQTTFLNEGLGRDSVVMLTASGEELEIPLAKIVRGYRPNAMNVFSKLGFYFTKLWEFVADPPREANTEGGIFPAIFGTVMMVMIMSIIVTPFGVVAAVYLREYARQGLATRIIRIAVNNLAGVPSIVFGMFGLGFFVYLVGGNIDRLFFPEALPSPTFGTGGILWASLTLALLTLPVVIVSTEEGLARIPRALREASLSLGATKAETLWRVVLPMASPAMMTGLILAVARAAGEVAPLMLVGVVKLAPSLPMDLFAPFVHLDRKFMHLGFHIYDVGFQSPNVEAARPLVYATALLLVGVIVLLNLTAVRIRNRLRERYKALDS